MSTYREWCDRIRAKPKRRAGNRYYTAQCPICRLSYDVDVLSSDDTARARAFQKVAVHIHTAHRDVITDAPKMGR